MNTPGSDIWDWYKGKQIKIKIKEKENGRYYL